MILNIINFIERNNKYFVEDIVYDEDDECIILSIKSISRTPYYISNICFKNNNFYFRNEGYYFNFQKAIIDEFNREWIIWSRKQKLKLLENG